MTAEIINLASKMKTDPAVRNFLATLQAGPEIHDALSIALPSLNANEQKVLTAVVAFRMMGAMLPASLEMLRRLPMFEGVHPENIGIACDFLHANGVIQVVTREESGESAFFWPALEGLYERALENANRSPLVGVDGNRL